MIELEIIRTAKGLFENGQFRRFHEETKEFLNMEEAEKFLKVAYGKHKRSPMFRDKPDGTQQKIGYVIGFKDYEYNDGKKYHFIEQDWITFFKKEVIEV